MKKIDEVIIKKNKNVWWVCACQGPNVAVRRQPGGSRSPLLCGYSGSNSELQPGPAWVSLPAELSSQALSSYIRVVLQPRVLVWKVVELNHRGLASEEKSASYREASPEL